MLQDSKVSEETVLSKAVSSQISEHLIASGAGHTKTYWRLFFKLSLDRILEFIEVKITLLHYNLAGAFDFFKFSK